MTFEFIDLVMYAFLGLMLGLAIGFKLGTSINTTGGDAYDRGVRDGIDFARTFHSHAKDPE